MPGGAEAIRAERSAASRMPLAPPSAASTGASDQGRVIVASAWIGTAAFAVATVAAVALVEARIAAAVVDLVLFLGGSVIYLWGWGVAAARSREAEITLWNLILLEAIAPRRVRVVLLMALGVQVVLAAATCWIAGALAFGWLAPMWGLAHCQLWGARHGGFGPRHPMTEHARTARR